MSPEFKYDVAFSFLSEDEDIALQLEGRVEDRLSTFLYSKRQNELVGADGEETLNRAFGADARLVVVLYRERWGTTPWSRVEETAIRNRGLQNGYDFVLVIPLDGAPKVPDWFPMTRIWYDLDRFGIDAAVAIIETRVQDAGGEVRAENPSERAARLQRQIDFEEEREALLRSDKGVKSARAAFQILVDDVKGWGDRIKEDSTHLIFRWEHVDRRCSLSCNGYTATLYWHLQYANTLRYSYLLLKFWNGAVALRNTVTFGDPEELEAQRFRFDVAPNAVSGWRREDSDSDRLLSSSALAEDIMMQLLDIVEQQT